MSRQYQCSVSDETATSTRENSVKLLSFHSTVIGACVRCVSPNSHIRTHLFREQTCAVYVNIICHLNQTKSDYFSSFQVVSCNFFFLFSHFIFSLFFGRVVGFARLCVEDDEKELLCHSISFTKSRHLGDLNK